MNDAFSLSRGNQINSLIPLKISKYLSIETDYLPWAIFMDRNNIKYYSEMLLTTELNGVMQKYLANLIEPLYNDLGWVDVNNEEWLNKYKLNKLI